MKTSGLIRLENFLVGRAPLMVAYSGGVDSSLLLAVATRMLGDRALGVIADSPSLPRKALHEALGQARRIGARVEVLRTAEFDNPEYVANPLNRCYFCKAELFRRMDEMARQRGFSALAYGENADDAPTLRPGSAAASEFCVCAPLREAGLGKNEVRALAREWGLPSADAPAQPCLSSRIPHGTPVTPEALALVERAEDALRAMGFRVLRVRLQSLGPPAALVQVAPEELPKLWDSHKTVLAALRLAGFASIQIDPLGYRGAGTL